MEFVSFIFGNHSLNFLMSPESNIKKLIWSTVGWGKGPSTVHPRGSN